MNVKFSELPYQRPDFEHVLNRIHELIQKINQEQNAEQYVELFLEADNLSQEFQTMYSICILRFYGNMADPYYQAEYMAFAEKLHIIMDEFEELMRAIIESKHSAILNEKFDSKTLHILKRAVALSSKNVQDLKAEIEQTSNAYNQWQSQLTFTIQNVTYNAMGLMACQSHIDRNIRKQTYLQTAEAYEKNHSNLVQWYSDLIVKRNLIAKENGDASYHDYSFKLYTREGYDKNDVRKYREAIAKYLVPVLIEANHIKSSLNKIDDLKIYDEKFWFEDGNPKPIGNHLELLQKGKEMYQALSVETNSLYAKMLDLELLDVENKPAKYGGGFATKLSKYQLPYIFTSFSGTDFDFRVLTHEFGHVYQFSYAFKNGFFGTENPCLDAVEAYSHGMEFITYPFVPLFFDKDSSKFYIKHFIETLTIMTSCCLGDEFQEMVYSKELTEDEERNKLYAALLNKYNKIPDFDDIHYLAAGNGWKMNGHFFNHPFYLIDYSFACILALQLYQVLEKDPKEGWSIYQRMCKASKGISLIELVELTGFKSPFDEENIKEISTFARRKMKEFFEKYKQQP